MIFDVFKNWFSILALKSNFVDYLAPNRILTAKSEYTALATRKFLLEYSNCNRRADLDIPNDHSN